MFGIDVQSQAVDEAGHSPKPGEQNWKSWTNNRNLLQQRLAPIVDDLLNINMERRGSRLVVQLSPRLSVIQWEKYKVHIVVLSCTYWYCGDFTITTHCCNWANGIAHKSALYALSPESRGNKPERHTITVSFRGAGQGWYSRTYHFNNSAFSWSLYSINMFKRSDIRSIQVMVMSQLWWAFPNW